LTGAQLLKQGKERLHELAEIEGLEGTLYVKLSAQDLLGFTELETEQTDDDGNVVEVSALERADRQNILLAKCLADENGDAILNIDQADELSEMDWDIYMGIVRGVMSVIGSKTEDVTGDDVTPLPDGESSPTS
jgi:hypothetical protein